MAKARPTFEELVRRVGPLPVTGLASAESPPVSAASVRAARTLVGGLPGSETRVARVAAKLDRLVELSKATEQSRVMKNNEVFARYWKERTPPSRVPVLLRAGYIAWIRDARRKEVHARAATYKAEPNYVPPRKLKHRGRGPGRVAQHPWDRLWRDR